MPAFASRRQPRKTLGVSAGRGRCAATRLVVVSVPLSVGLRCQATIVTMASPGISVVLAADSLNACAGVRVLRGASADIEVVGVAIDPAQLATGRRPTGPAFKVHPK